MVLVGGTIPTDDVDELRRLGVAEVFTPERARRLPHHAPAVT